MRWYYWIIIAAVILVTVIVAAKSHQRPTAKTTNSAKPTTQLKGVSFSPRSFSAADQADFYTQAKLAGNAVEWVGDWQNLADSSSAPYAISRQATKNGLTPIVVVSVYNQGQNLLLRPLSAENIASYLASAQKFAAAVKPPYLGLGVEINILAAKQPAAYTVFTGLFSQAKAAVKLVSPATKVFPVFQLEKMKGLNGGLFGGSNDAAANQWALLADFPDADLIAFTSYPGLVYHNPNSLPADYYSEIAARTALPIAFSELGWHSSSSPKGWESSEIKQQEFVQKLATVYSQQKPNFMIWSFLYDQTDVDPFRGLGLLTGTGPRASWATWLKIGT